MLVVADSSPLRYLTVIAPGELLPSLFGEVWVPGTVRDELTRSSTPDAVRELFVSGAPWLNTRDPNPDRVARIRSDLDPGERAALALAQEMGADLILIDDAAGRREAALLGIRMTGTLGVLRLAAERGLIDVPEVAQRLRHSGIYPARVADPESPRRVVIACRPPCQSVNATGAPTEQPSCLARGLGDYERLAGARRFGAAA